MPLGRLSKAKLEKAFGVRFLDARQERVTMCTWSGHIGGPEIRNPRNTPACAGVFRRSAVQYCQYAVRRLFLLCVSLLSLVSLGGGACHRGFPLLSQSRAAAIPPHVHDE